MAYVWLYLQYTVIYQQTSDQHNKKKYYVKK